LAVRSIVFKLTKGNAPEHSTNNAKVRELIRRMLWRVMEVSKKNSKTMERQSRTSEPKIYYETKIYLAKIDKKNYRTPNKICFNNCLASKSEKYKKS